MIGDHLEKQSGCVLAQRNKANFINRNQFGVLQHS